ncbi:hypothetical protein [Prosthecobacter sp.]|uniref:hypothetical protein n=1 Tax=Prosthecobacter sp. TaxID=1965333 RepID=UPI003784D879
MKKLLLLIWLLTLTACTDSAPGLTSRGQKAFRVLKEADKFYDSAVGFAGTTPEVVRSFQILLKEEDADAAFKVLLQEATLPGQLYALCGLWFTDQAAFKLGVARYSASTLKVPAMMGCVVADEQVSELVECRQPGTVHLNGPKDSLSEWWKRNKTENVSYDIAGGAWPSNFKEAKP